MNNSIKPLSTLGAAIEKRRKSSLVKTDRRETIASTVRLLALIGAIVVLFVIFFGFKVIDGNEMYPALSDGDLVLTYFKPSIKKGEIVFYEVNEEEYCGRIVAKAGDNVDFSEDGKLYVNGTAQTTEIVFPTYAPEGWEGSAVVPAGTVLILGDQRMQARDSRLFGFIPIENIKCKAIALLRHKQL